MPRPVHAFEAAQQGLTCLVSPVRPEGVVKSWRKLVTGVDGRERGAFALEGKFLEPSVAYELPVGAVVVVVDRYPDRWEVALTRAGTGELEPMREPWLLKGSLGKRVTDYIARRLPDGAGGHRARRMDDVPNDYAARCPLCRNTVGARAGRLIPGGRGSRAAHLAGACPPPPPRPEIITPNRYAQECLICGGWVEAGTGVARLLSEEDPVTGWYRAAHAGECPVDAVPGPANRTGGWCAVCGEFAAPGEGFWLLGADELRHRGPCPDPVTVPTWQVRGPAGEAPLEPGQVRRVQVDLRGGQVEFTREGELMAVTWKRPDNAPVPLELPGVRVLSPTYVELVAVVLECVEGRRGRRRARVRAATGAEAADVLAAELAQETGLRPVMSTLRGSFSATQIGARPWLAEIVGRDPDHRFDRRFQAAHTDYTNSNRKGTRGALFHWVLRPNAVYETEYATSWSHRVREFLAVDDAGDVKTLTEQEVIAWLNTAATWPGH